MKRTHPALWGAGWAGLFVAALLVGVGVSQPGELASMTAGYGLMLAGSAVYLLAGLKLRERLVRRATPMAASAAPSAGR
jgi:hypothetical protein